MPRSPSVELTPAERKALTAAKYKLLNRALRGGGVHRVLMYAIEAAKVDAVAALGAFPVALRVLDLDRRLGSVPAEAREGVRLLEYRMWADEQPADPPTGALAATATGGAA